MRFFIFFLFFISLFAEDKKNIMKDILSNNEFVAEYEAYLNYQKVQEQIYKYQKLAKSNPKYLKELLKFKAQLKLLESNKDIYNKLVKLKPLPEPVKVENPFQIISAINYEKNLLSVMKENKFIYSRFKHTLNTIKNLYEKTKDKNLYLMLKDFEIIDSIYKIQLSALNSKFLAYKKEIQNSIQNQINKFIMLLFAIAISVLFFTVLKLIFRKYVKGESVYFINKFLNILNITTIILIVMFFYINNATYLITILGFASAGIAIAMKDWFMNVFGWFVIMTSGNFKVGDRIKIYLQNGQVRIVGDIIDITMTRIVIYEDVTFESFRTNKRAGRVIFVPNNVIFVNPIFNYTHNGLSTVWDTIEIVITFDSNYKKAVYLAKEIVNKYSKGYTDITKRRIQKLRANYNIKNTSFEPRIYTFVERYGIVISCWYLNSYATLNLKSTISAELLESFEKESDIKLAYPTYEIKSNNEEIKKALPAV